MSKAEQMGVSPSQISCHTKRYSCPEQATPEEAQEFDAEFKHGGILKDRQLLEAEIVRTEPGDTSTGVSLCGANEPLQPSSEDRSKTSLPEDGDPPPQNASKSGLTDKISSPKLTAEDHTLEFGSKGAHSDLGTACSYSGLSKEKDLIGSGFVQNEPRGTSTGLAGSVVNEALLPVPEDASENSFSEELRLPNEEARESNQCHQLTISGQILDFPCKEPSVRQKFSLELIQNKPVEIIATISGFKAAENLEPPPKLVTNSCSTEHSGQPTDREVNFPATEQLGPSHDDVDKHSILEQLDIPSKDAVSNSSHSGCRVKRTPKLSRKKYMLRSLTGNERFLRSRSQEKRKAPETSNNLADANSCGERKRKRKKKRREKRVLVDEYSRIRAHLRYLLNRISYEQSLITAYSGEGWKGLSLEKLKPEKELQRATSEIFRRKLKLRDLFQRIDSLCAQGRLPASLFDSEGQIDSEDIFCAKCGSKDLTADNDIILCDGACDRGFHQFCLVPPLLKEDIPPDDEGWLCPGCDCKVDCIDLLNDSQGTNLSLSDSWEKVFPEAAAAVAGGNLDHNFGLPSDDSDDDDYDPDGPELDDKSEGDVSSSDESDFTSASDEFEAPPNEDQYFGLPSDDPEDDDYNPDAPDLEEKVKKESSSSDFTSDSEDLAAALDNNELSAENESMSVQSHRDSNRQRSRLSEKNKRSLKSELSSLLEPDPGQDGSASVSGRRNVERLDYKKLYDETYGNVSSDSNEDEDFTDAVGPRKRRKSTGEVVPVSANGNASLTKTQMSSHMKQDLKETKPTSTRTHQTSNCEGANISPAEAIEVSSRASSGSKKGSSKYRRLGEAVTQRLYKSFKENQYPDRATKESLAKELGLTFQQVGKWFDNARWSFSHSKSMDESIAKSTSERESPVPRANERLHEAGPGIVGTDRGATCNGAQSEESFKAGAANVESPGRDMTDSKLENKGSSEQKIKTSQSRGRKHKSDYLTNLPKAQDMQADGRRTRRKSIT